MSEAELVVVGSFLNHIDAALAQGALEAANIESMLSPDDAGSLRPHLSIASGIRLLVRAEDAAEATEILSQASSPRPS